MFSVLDRAVSTNGSADILGGCAPEVATKPYNSAHAGTITYARSILLGVERKRIGKRTREGRKGNYECSDVRMYERMFHLSCCHAFDSEKEN